MKKILLFGFIIAVFSSCHRYYTHNNISQFRSSIRTVAVLPVEMVFTGLMPKNMREEDILRQEENESKIFQQSLHDNLLRFADFRRRTSTVQVQPVTSTLQLLSEKGISLRQSWTMDSRELASLLGVDAVVRCRISKNRYMSDAASFGISAANTVLGAIGRNNNVFVPNGPTRTNDINASCNLVANGQTIWADQYNRGADFNTPPDLVVDNITRNFGRRFPL